MIPITKPEIGPQEAEAVAEVVRSGWLAQGPRLAAFEQAVADYVGAPYAIGTSSGTAALHLCLLALKIGSGDEVLLPSLSFIATANVVTYTGAEVVFVDIDPRTFNLDPDHLESLITSRSRAILPVHQLGYPAAMERINAIARKHSLHVIEDAACALGTTYQGSRIGASSASSCCFSFHPRKIITTGEGGMVTTHDSALAERLLVLRSHGQANTSHPSITSNQQSYCHLGYNYRLTDIQAAIGFEQMKRLPGLLSRRRALARRYHRLLSERAEITVPVEPSESGSQHTFQSYMILLKDDLSVTDVMQTMKKKEVDTRPAVMAIHQLPIYRRGKKHPHLPNTDRVVRQGLMLPLYPSLSEAEQDYVVQTLLDAIPGSRTRTLTES